MGGFIRLGFMLHPIMADSRQQMAHKKIEVDREQDKLSFLQPVVLVISTVPLDGHCPFYV